MSHVTPDEWECAMWMINFEEATMSAVKFIGDGSGVHAHMQLSRSAIAIA